MSSFSKVRSMVTVLLAVVLRDDPLVVLLEVGPQRVAREQAPDPLLYRVPERLYRGPPGGAALELPLEPVEVDRADVVRRRSSAV